LNDGRQIGGALFQHLGQILAGVLASGEIQRDPARLDDPHQPAGEHSGPLRGDIRIPVQRQHAHGSVVVVHHFGLRRLALEFLQRWLERGRGLRHDLALCRRWQRDSEVRFQTFRPIPRDAAAVAQQGDHGGSRFVVLFLAGLGRSLGGVHVPAQITSQLFQLIDGRGQRRLPFDPHQHAGFALRIDLAAALIRTRVSRL
jgi:hypothetical protein